VGQTTRLIGACCLATTTLFVIFRRRAD
jgi:hypothetical protein